MICNDVWLGCGDHSPIRRAVACEKFLAARNCCAQPLRSNRHLIIVSATSVCQANHPQTVCPNGQHRDTRFPRTSQPTPETGKGDWAKFRWTVQQIQPLPRVGGQSRSTLRGCWRRRGGGAKRSTDPAPTTSVQRGSVLLRELNLHKIDMTHQDAQHSDALLVRRAVSPPHPCVFPFVFFLSRIILPKQFRDSVPYPSFLSHGVSCVPGPTHVCDGDQLKVFNSRMVFLTRTRLAECPTEVLPRRSVRPLCGALPYTPNVSGNVGVRHHLRWQSIHLRPTGLHPVYVFDSA